LREVLCRPFFGRRSSRGERTPKAVEQVTGIQCVILPTVKENRQDGSTKSTLIEEFVLDAPFSRFTETLRNVKVLIGSAQFENGGKVIGVVSSVTKEGKTTIAANLAALVATSSGARTPIIDSDVLDGSCPQSQHLTHARDWSKL
jgi:polysaccharide biosynthesis transport protein